MARRINARSVKRHRSYTIEQLSELLDVTVGTVRRWTKSGLPCLTDTRPYLIQGADFQRFHAERLTRATTKLQPFEVFCLGCKGPRLPKSGFVASEAIDASRARIMAICPVCANMLRRIIRRSDERKWAVKFGFAPNTREDA